MHRMRVSLERQMRIRQPGRSRGQAGPRAALLAQVSGLNRDPVGLRSNAWSAPRTRHLGQARAALQQAREASPDKASTQSLDEGCVIGTLTSNGILAAASFLVGTAPSKILAHRQATLPLCA